MEKWIRSAIPALLIHCSIGTVYCWSTFKQAIAEAIGMTPSAVGWAFSLAIFFLGMSAAFAGKLVEINIHKSSLVAAICFTVGMIGTGLTLMYCTGVMALILIYIFYGCIMGIGLGVGYLPCMLGDLSPGIERVGPIEPMLNDDLWLLTHPDIRRSRQ